MRPGSCWVVHQGLIDRHLRERNDHILLYTGNGNSAKILGCQESGENQQCRGVEQVCDDSGTAERYRTKDHAMLHAHCFRIPWSVLRPK